MKFENLYKLMVNEAIDIEDTEELKADPVSIEANTPFPAMEPTLTPEAMTNDQKVDYLVKNSKVINRNPNKTEAEKIAQAKWIIENGFFDSFAETIGERQAAIQDIGEPEAEALEELPPELEADEPTPEDVVDIKTGLSAHKTLRQREQEAEEEALGGQD